RELHIAQCAVELAGASDDPIALGAQYQGAGFIGGEDACGQRDAPVARGKVKLRADPAPPNPFQLRENPVFRNNGAFGGRRGTEWTLSSTSGPSPISLNPAFYSTIFQPFWTI